MTPEEIRRQRRVLDALDTALQWPRDTRARMLAETFGEEPWLLAELRELIAEAERAQGSLPTALPMAAALGSEPEPPATLGPWRLGELLGRGGMGRVYRAQRNDGSFEQRVAVKVLRQSLTGSVAAVQFARERQILADLQHPNIARLLDGGVAAGTSYIVMELIEGAPLSEHVFAQGMDMAQSLQLFLHVCEAVAYAHSRLVVHADIKPSNVLVDAQGQPKLVDFGVARLLAASAAEPGAAPQGLTPIYSSPARRAGEPATTGDDVYSLGVLLGELCERCAPVPADLASLVARARADDPAARYASVTALAEDVGRWLAGQPVLAHRGGWRYPVGRFLRRHRLATIAVGALAGLLVVAVVALAIALAREQRARALADRRFDEVHALARYALFDVYDRLEQVPRALPLRRDVAVKAQRYLDGLAADPRASVELQLEVIEGLRRLAQVQSAPGSANLGQTGRAKVNLAHAQSMLDALRGSAAPARSLSVLDARLHLQRAAIAHAVDLDFATAEHELAACRAVISRLEETAPADPQARQLFLDWSVEESAVQQWRGRHAEASRTARLALGRMDAGDALQNARRDGLQRSRLLDIDAESMFYAGDAAGAVAPYREQIAILSRLAAADPQDVHVARRLARAGWALGSTLTEVGAAAEGARVLGDARARFEQVRLLEPEDRELARGLDITTDAYASALIALHRYPEALPLLEASARLRSQLVEAAPADPRLRRDQAIALVTWADGLAAAGRGTEACVEYGKAFAAFEQVRQQGRLSPLDAQFALPRLRENRARYCH